MNTFLFLQNATFSIPIYTYSIDMVCVAQEPAASEINGGGGGFICR